ncbi:heparan-alpha-glucosaminide N-acetyltransferase domain-containing protein [Sphingomonas sp. ST-64]|uniref:Heparan-alpha-glucosaminide N-acetyltransferase domain-containing protein n=1 Tax=Sphingomonas plantiphila TaxID=3163295 RepID=A0ABW8YL78_9SPHN
MRLISLDVLRGLTVAGMILVNSAAAMKWGADAEVAPILLHKSWDGLTLADLVFPGFLTMVGIAIPFSLRDPKPGQQGRALARAGRLVLLGVILSNLYWATDFDAHPFRVFGVLQRIGLVYGACALLYLTAGPRLRIALIAVILIGYWPLTLLPAPDGLPNDLWQRGHNFVASLDRVVLGAHRYVQGPEGYDPEGILGTLPAIAQGLIGVVLGEFLRNRSGGRTRALALAGGAMVAVGAAWSFAFPIVKDIWSSSFVLVTSGIITLALAALHPWLDRTGQKPGPAATAMIAFGGNAIAAYTLHQLTASMVTWDLLRTPFDATRTTLGDPVASLIPVLLYMVLIWAAMEWLRRKAWIIKI